MYAYCAVYPKDGFSQRTVRASTPKQKVQLKFAVSLSPSALISDPPLLTPNRVVDIVVKASASRAADPGFDSRLRREFFFQVESLHMVILKLVLQWLPCQAPGVIGSALGLVGPVSVHCGWVR